MIMPQVRQCTSSRALLIPTILSSHGHTFIPNKRKSAGTTARQNKSGVGLRVNAIPNPFPDIPRPAQTTDVEAIISVKGFFSSAGLASSVANIVSGSIILELVSTDGKTVKARAREVIPRLFDQIKYQCNFDVPADFGQVGAIKVENELPQEQYLNSIVLSKNLPCGSVTIHCNSWVHSKHFNTDQRVFFTNKSYLPSQTPAGLKELRERDLESLRGNGKGIRRMSDRIYDYDKYNDLGSPDVTSKLARSVLGGSQHPYPRRCRTGRAPTTTDPLSESRTLVPLNYVPRDEAFSDVKTVNFGAHVLSSALNALIPFLETVLAEPDHGFPQFTRIDSLFKEGVPIGTNLGMFKLIAPRIVKALEDGKNNILLFETPELINRDKFAWATDEEFSRQTLAGMNPCSIQLVTEWPLKSTLDPNVYGPAESAITKEIVEREIKGNMTLDEALANKKLFVIDYHDLLLPYVQKVRELEGTTLYGSRILFQCEDNTLRPLAIELTRPPIDSKPHWRHVYTPGWDATSSWLWRLAKAHVTAHDTGYHQLVSHWLRAHCCTEPYIIAANRQLCVMHPIYRLLSPHFRYTMEINALARGSFINAGGIIEKAFSPEKYSMELSSAAYDQIWRFDMEALPADLIRRGMAEEDPTAEHGVKLTIEDYPFANDGLLIWDAIRTWVSDYVNHYYADDISVKSDTELQAFWTEVRTKGHEDKKDEPWWPVLNTRENLIQTLTTIIWVSSGHHAAVNFGQYGYGGYFPNRITIARTNMPNEDPTEETFKEFLTNPELALLKCFPSQIQATTVMTLLDVLSTHSADEEYIGEEPEPSWSDDLIIMTAFQRYAAKLKEIEGVIDARNADPNLKNRYGPGVIPYELLKPSSTPGVTMRGVPNSIST